MPDSHVDDVEDSLIPSIAVARFISADDAQDMILAVPLPLSCNPTNIIRVLFHGECTLGVIGI